MAASTTPTSTYKSFLMHKNVETWEKLCDITEYPDMGGEPNMIDVTTLSQNVQSNVPGVQQSDSVTFVANYIKGDFDKINELAGTSGEYSLWFGATEGAGTLTPNGDDGKFDFTGTPTVYVVGGGVDDTGIMNITFACTVPPHPAVAEE